MRRVEQVMRVLAGVAAVGALMLSPGSPAFSAPEKDVIVVNPPTKPVPVTGVVEAVNDAIHPPYIRLGSASLAAGTTIGEVPFDVPDGKRLIVEAVSVQASVSAGQKVRVFLDVQDGISPILSVLPVQSPGSFGGTEYWVANLPFKLRKDAMSGTTDEIRVRMQRDSAAGEAGLLVTIHGYLVDP